MDPDPSGPKRSRIRIRGGIKTLRIEFPMIRYTGMNADRYTNALEALIVILLEKDFLHDALPCSGGQPLQVDQDPAPIA